MGNEKEGRYWGLDYGLRILVRSSTPRNRSQPKWKELKSAWYCSFGTAIIEELKRQIFVDVAQEGVNNGKTCVV